MDWADETKEEKVCLPSLSAFGREFDYPSPFAHTVICATRARESGPLAQERISGDHWLP